jgi:hypothetical protein
MKPTSNTITCKHLVCVTATALLFLAGATHAAADSTVAVSTGYYDLPQGTIAGDLALPDPWLGSPNTTFYGATSLGWDPDINGVLLRNLGSAAVTLSALTIGGTFDLFALDNIVGPITLLAGQNYVFAGVDGSDENFAEFVSLVVDGQAYQYADAFDSTLYPEGVLHGFPSQQNETVPWTVIYAPVSTASVPESSATLPLLGLGLGVLGYCCRWMRFAAGQA